MLKEALKMKRRIVISLTLVLTVLSLLTGCYANDEGSTASTDGFYSFTDSLGRSVNLNSRPERVAVLTGSYADTWLLAGGTLHATTQDAWDDGEFAIPDGVLNLGSIRTPSMEIIVENDIDFIILSAKIEDHVKLSTQLESLNIRCAYFEVEVFDDYLHMLKICTDITGEKNLYKKNGTDVRAQIDKAVERKAGKNAPSVLLMRAFSTGVSVKNSDNMAGAMIKEMGCINIADSDRSLLENLSMEIIIQEDPDYIFFVTMGSSEEKALASMRAALEENPAFNSLRAVKSGNYIQLPKALFHLKQNSQWGESYEFLADILYGEDTE